MPGTFYGRDLDQYGRKVIFKVCNFPHRMVSMSQAFHFEFSEDPADPGQMKWRRDFDEWAMQKYTEAMAHAKKEITTSAVTPVIDVAPL